MKLQYLLFSATVLVGACNSKPTSTEQAAPKTHEATVAKTKVKEAKAETANSSTETVASTNTNSTEMSSESDNTAKAKKGWSKTAKGAVIGGVVGAGTGAVVNKKNRAVGAVVGGAAGAGVGAIIGNEMDKKDGRH